MGQQILLQREIAELVSGNYGKFSKIEPVQLKDGTFALPVETLKHADLKDFQKLILPFLTSEKITKAADFKVNETDFQIGVKP